MTCVTSSVTLLGDRSTSTDHQTASKMWLVSPSSIVQCKAQ